VRFLFLVEIDGPALGFPVQVHVGDVGKPECRGLVEMLQRSERAAVEQVGFEIGKGIMRRLRIIPLLRSR